MRRSAKEKQRRYDRLWNEYERARTELQRVRKEFWELRQEAKEDALKDAPFGPYWEDEPPESLRGEKKRSARYVAASDLRLRDIKGQIRVLQNFLRRALTAADHGDAATALHLLRTVRKTLDLPSGALHPTNFQE